MLEKFSIIYSTVKKLKFIQIRYQLLYRLKKGKSLEEYRIKKLSHTVFDLKFRFHFPVFKSYFGNNTFNFLNLEHHFHDEIDWAFSRNGALWNYNLQYFNFLGQKDVTTEEKLRLLESFYSSGITLEPYPVSLRSINVIRFLIRENLQEEDLIQSLYGELHFLSQRLEYHILGNHLLENVFALCMGGAFFLNDKWHKHAMKVLRRELDEQILSDGAHFELSPMYHQIIFFRLLELIDWYSNYEGKENEFLTFCLEKAALMRAWLRNICFKNGDIPLFNDSAKGIAYETSFLFDYAEQLGIENKDVPLGESGYRSFQNEQYEVKIDFAQIGASYQPGHAHADALSFILYHDGKPLFVEQGTSTYNIGNRRDLERSTEAHNTVVVNSANQSEVWGGFRVGKRAKTTILEDSVRELKACHDGYKKLGVIHTRKFNFEKESFKINDFLTNKGEGVFYLHLFPGSEIAQGESHSFIINNKIQIRFSEAESYRIEKYKYAESYNLYQESERIIVEFKDHLETSIFF